MKSFRKVAIAAMLAVVPALAVGTAWANTELVPGSRLVAPYWDIRTAEGRTTLLLIANVSRRANLQKNADIGNLSGACNLDSPTGPTGIAGTNCAVHLEFYDKTCDNIDLTIDLSKQDIDQLDLLNDSDLGGVRALASGTGWVDIDVRRAITGSGHTNTSVQANVLVGTVVISDSDADFAVAYPMAASQGSSDGGSGAAAHDIVSRDGQGDANVWTGAFESFPAKVYVPMFFAEGVNGSYTFTSTLAIAGPAQSIRGGEAPGQDLEDDQNTAGINEGILIDAEVDIVDACENAQSDDLRDHYIIGTLQGLFTNDVTAPYNTTGTIGTCVYPSADVDRKATGAFQGGFIDIANNALALEWSGGVSGTQGSPNYGIERGLVGVLIQGATAGSSKTGDAMRLWGECSYGTDGSGGIASTGCRESYSLVDSVSHADLRP
ncbi:MAG TPA: hypothetical protein VN494_10375 [Patescibacteria group bacterium]|nr:hypothetical protein [Patescibacteria group bacterium]